jgi:hypothetical protein
MVERHGGGGRRRSPWRSEPQIGLGGPGSLSLWCFVMPQNWHLGDYSDHATIYMMSLWKRTTKRLVHVTTCT